MTDPRPDSPISHVVSDAMRRGYPGDSSWERAVTARMAQNDRLALTELFDRTAPRVYALILRSVRSPEKAGEILGLVFEEFWQERHRANSQLRPLVRLLIAARRLACERGLPFHHAADTEIFSLESSGRDRPPGAGDLLRQIYFDCATIPRLASEYGMREHELRETLAEAMDQLRREMKAGKGHG